jgi:hypothetical protein
MDDSIEIYPERNSGVIDELRVTEGMIFRDEISKKLFLDIKEFLMETLLSKWRTFDEESFNECLNDYIVWDEDTSKIECETAEKTYKDIYERLIKVTTLYAKYLYSSLDHEKKIVLKKPLLESFLKGMFSRACKMQQIRTGAFFNFTPLNQDFALRDVFRQTLSADCMDVITSEVFSVSVEQKHKEKEENKEMEKMSETKSEVLLEDTEKKSHDKFVLKDDEEEEEDDDDHSEDLFPDDSVSQRGSQIFASFSKPVDTDKKSKDNNSVREGRSMYTKISKAQTTASSTNSSSAYRKPSKLIMLEEGIIN